jgi:hypothetical protein
MFRTPTTVDRRDVLVVLAFFAASRIFYGFLGLRFDAGPFPSYMQFIDRALLETRLIESLWYYHANPPVLNFLTGVALQLFGDHMVMALAVLFHVLGFAIAFSVYVLSLCFSSSRMAAVCACALLVFSPAFVLYENWLMYSFLSVAFLTLAALFLFRYLQSQRRVYGALFFWFLALLLLTRSLFHLGFMLIIVGLLMLVQRERRWQIGSLAIAPILVVVLWYGKNYVLFGTFGASTWMGLGLSNISTLVPTRNELEPLVHQGRLSRFALVSRYRQLDQLFAEPHPDTGIPALDQVVKSTGGFNFNNSRIVALNRFYTADGFEVIRTFPYYYTVGLNIANRLYFSPSNMNLYFSPANRAAVSPMEKVFNPLLYGVGTRPEYIKQPHFGFSDEALLEVNTSIPLIVTWALLLGYGYIQTRRSLLSHDQSHMPRGLVIGFIVVTALYLQCVGTAFELAENYRYRYNVEPLMFAIASSAITDFARGLRAKFRSRHSAELAGNK